MKRTTLSGNTPKRKLIVEIIAAILILFFAHTAIDNIIDRLSLRNLLRILPLTYNKADIVSWTIPFTKLSVTFLLFFPRTRLYGGILALITMTIFSAYLIYTSRWPHEFGGILNFLSFKQHLILSMSLAAISLILIILSNKRARQGDSDTQPTVIFT